MLQSELVLCSSKNSDPDFFSSLIDPVFDEDGIVEYTIGSGQ